eukprot:TRINITY_DN779_c0_g2_i1.p2 TRINITY_DN779_c0_g2~~TRINITY_DN779_c0_g2_i1.p2  ORF type:complete len:168 (-),score=27.32 TRINITY_DN779_c0_g2_i1:132-635(-)
MMIGKIAVALFATSVAIAGASQESFWACHRKILTSCDGIGICSGTPCTPVCHRCILGVAKKLDGSCCVELPVGERDVCVTKVKKFAASIDGLWDEKCPTTTDTFGEFEDAMLSALPFAFQKADKLSVAVEQHSYAQIGSLAVGVVVAGAVGGAIALAVRTLGSGKRH